MKAITTILVLSCLFSCTTDDEITGNTPQLVVEGWIENGKFPEVILTTTIPISKDYQSLSNIDRHLIKWAKVTIDDGERSVVLTGRIDKSKYPPYRYSTGEMRGEAGRIYRLTVEHEDYYATSVTTIPDAVEIDSLKFECYGNNEGSRRITAFFNNNNAPEADFQFFTYSTNDKYRCYSPSHTGYVSHETNKGNISRVVCKGRTINNWEDYITDFNPGDSVMVKLCRLDSLSSIFWRNFEEMSLLSRNPFFPVTQNLGSNINGGIGYWFGYGASEQMIVLPK